MRINHVQIKDVRAEVLARIDRAKTSFLDFVLDGVFTAPGDGMIAFQDVMRRLMDGGYEGWVIVEAEQDPAKQTRFHMPKKAMMRY